MTRFVFDERALEQLEVMYRTRDAVRRRRLVRDALGAKAGDSVLDVGCGPGFLSAEILEDVGATGAVVGVDSSATMLAAAMRRCAGLGHATFHEGDAVSLPVEDESFDRAVCVQVLEFVPNVQAALGELFRALRPGGRVLVWDIDWSTLSWHSTDPLRMQRMLQAWDRHLAHPTLPRTLAPALRRAGFDDARAEGHAFTTTALDPERYGGMALGVVERFLSGLSDVDQGEAKAWAEEQRDLGARGEYYYSVTQVCFTARRAG